MSDNYVDIMLAAKCISNYMYYYRYYYTRLLLPLLATKMHIYICDRKYMMYTGHIPIDKIDTWLFVGRRNGRQVLTLRSPGGLLLTR